MEQPVSSTPTAQPNNRMALTSLISGIVAWALWLLLLCFNWTIGLVFSLVTFGLAGICFGIVSFLPVIPWLVAVVTGHVGISQIGRTGEGGKGLAIAGLIMGYLGLVLTLCTLVLAVLAWLGVIASSSFPVVPTPYP
jgi:hypothetical protein